MTDVVRKAGYLSSDNLLCDLFMIKVFARPSNPSCLQGVVADEVRARAVGEVYDHQRSVKGRGTTPESHPRLRQGGNIAFMEPRRCQSFQETSRVKSSATMTVRGS